ncbi:GEVED domain-containing protein [Photobacterium kishitanii]|uniref:GEVED domain-containing protein n=1 Tax=Photobacterium kishitanii TaxID=318456 RepID=UPI001EFDFCF2|nr:L-type lectin domain-containing protein [Photobacterium kishitanii]
MGFNNFKKAFYVIILFGIFCSPLINSAELICNSSSQTIDGASITTLDNYNSDPADGFSGMSIVGNELISSAANSVGNPLKRFELEILSPGSSFTYPIGIEIEFRLKGGWVADSDTDPMFWLTDHQNMNGVLIGDNALWVGSHATWNGTNQTINYTNASVNNMSNTTGRLTATFKRYRMKMYVQSDNSTTIQLTTMQDDGTVIETSPVRTGVLSIDPANGIYFAHTTHFNDNAANNYHFGGTNFVVSDSSDCDYGDAPDPSVGVNIGNYETLAATGGPAHQIDGVIYLGTTPPDADTNAFFDGVDTNGNATDDDMEGTATNDEDGISSAIIVAGSSHSLTAICNDYDAISGDLGAIVHAWLDVNRNGDFEVSEYSSAACNDTSSTNDGTATLSWAGLTPSIGISYARFRITDSILTDDGSGNDDRAYGAVKNGEVEDYQISITPVVSGFVFNDNGATTGTKNNGIKEGDETGLGIAVNIIAHDTVNNICYTITSDAVTGAYQLSVPIGSYNIYEAALEIDMVNPTCPPTVGVFDPLAGGYDGATIGDPINHHSSSANVQAVNVMANVTDVNFADFSYTPYPTCSKLAYLLKNAPTDVTSIDLAQGTVTPLFNNVLASAIGVFGGSGYNFITNTIIGDNIRENDDVLMIDGNGDVFILPITNSTMAQSNYNSGDIDDNGVLFLVHSNGTQMYQIDVNPNSSTYLQQIGVTSITAPPMADWAFNPIDNQLYTLTRTAQLYRFNPATGARTDLGNVGTAGTTSAGWGAIYFDEQGFMYAAQNPSPGRIVRIDISDPNLGINNYSAENFTQTNSATGQNDGARCRFATILIDWGDAPISYGTLLANDGPRHLITGDAPYLGVLLPDRETDGQASLLADGDDSNGARPDDEDGYIQTDINSILVGGDTYTITVPVVSSGDDNLYGWIDFDNNGTFEIEERATTSVNSSGNVSLSFTVPNDVVIVETTYIRLRVCSSATNCEDPTGSAGDGEIEDHLINLTPIGDLELTLRLDPLSTVTLGVPFNVIASVMNKGATIVSNTTLSFPIPSGYSFVRAYQGDGVTPLTITEYDPATGIIDLGNIGTGFNDYAIIRLAPQSMTAGVINSEIKTASVQDIDSTPNNGFSNGEDDTDAVTPTITNIIQPSTCDAPRAYAGEDAYVDTNGEYIVTPNAGDKKGYLWSLDFIDLNQPLYAELAVYLGDRSANSGGAAGEIGADGMTFVLSADPRGINAIGGFGGGLGVGPVNGGVPVSPSVVFEFDTFDNTFIGANDDALGGQYIDHTGVYLNGQIYNTAPATTLIPATSVNGGELEDGRYHIAQFEWDPATNIFSYKLDGQTIGTFTRNIRTDLGSNIVRFGFTGSTGAAWNLQKGCFTFAPNVLGSDYGDAPDSTTSTGFRDYQTTYQNGGAQHVQSDVNDDGEIDLLLGNKWDADIGTLQDIAAVADDDNNIPDEDGVNILQTMTISTMTDISITVTEDPVRPETDIYIYGWIDWNQDGDWLDTGEQVVTETSGVLGVNNYSIPVPATANVGYTYARFRLCGRNDCSTPLGLSSDGEVEDYRILVSDLIPNTTCDVVVQTRKPQASTDYSYNELNITSDPLSWTSLVSSIAIASLPNSNNINAIGFNRNVGLFYGAVTDMSTTEREHHLFVTDRIGTSFIDLGKITALSTSTIKRLDTGDSFTFNSGDALRHTGYVSAPGKVLASPTVGDISQDGSTLVIWRTSWDSLVKVDLATQTFTTVLLDIATLGTSVGGGNVDVGADIAISAQNGLGYLVDFVGGNLYSVDINTGAVIAAPLNFVGAQPTLDGNNKLQPGGLVIDDWINIYAFTNGGNHDSDNNGMIDLNTKASVYQINVITQRTSFMLDTDETQLQGNDAAGCVEAIDYGDAKSSYGQVSHPYIDVTLDGNADIQIGTFWDPEFTSWHSPNSDADDSHSLDDEDFAIPASIVVETSTPLSISIIGSGVINIWVDLNNDGDFSDQDEQVATEVAVVNGLNTIPIILNGTTAAGFNGYTVMRLRVCSSTGDCNTASGMASDGEVEDHRFELLNRIILQGVVFEDNGVGAGAIAHDGIQSNNEKGIAGYIVQAIYKGTGSVNYNNNDIIQTNITKGNGSYQLILPVEVANSDILLKVVKKSNWIDISEFDNTLIPQVVSPSTNSITDSEVLLNPSAGDIINNLNFGKIKQSVLESDNFSEVIPGSAVYFTHKFTSFTDGDVNFSIINKSQTPSDINYSTAIYRDENCNGKLEISTESLLLNSITVDENNRDVCLIIKIFIPNETPLGSIYKYDLEADITYSDNVNTGHGIKDNLINKDQIKVAFNGAGELFINKTVQNITQGTDISISNKAVPDDVIEYTIHFSNVGLGQITDIKLFDSVPLYTYLHDPIQCSGGDVLLPSLIVTCTIALKNGSNTNGYDGVVEWVLTGTLLAGEKGFVKYRVKIE